MIILKINKKIIILFLSVFLFSSTGLFAQNLTSIRSLGKNYILLVGRINLLPRLEKEEQNLRGFFVKRFKNSITIIISDKIFDIKTPSLRSNKYSHRVRLNSDFFIAVKRHHGKYYLGGVIYMGPDEFVFLPGGLKYNIRPSDKAVYIGTIQYRRDDYNSIKEVKLLNQYRSANSGFIKRFGNSVKLRRIQPIIEKKSNKAAKGK